MNYKEVWYELKEKTNKDIKSLQEKLNNTGFYDYAEKSRLTKKIQGLKLTLENMRQLESSIDLQEKIEIEYDNSSLFESLNTPTVHIASQIVTDLKNKNLWDFLRRK